MNDVTVPTVALSEPELAVISERVQRLLASMGIDQATLRCHHLSPYLYITIEAGPDGKLLIGAGGAHLLALQHLLRSMMRSTVPAGTRVVVDVNGYRVRREQSLVAAAEEAAGRALRQGQAVILPPMSSADRRTIHTALAQRTDIMTESTGVEPKRSVAIRPVF